MRRVQRVLGLIALLTVPSAAYAQQIMAAGQPAQLDVRLAGDSSIRVTLKPVSFKPDFPVHPAIAARTTPAPVLTLRELTSPVQETDRYFYRLVGPPY